MLDRGGHSPGEVVGNRTLTEYCGRNKHGHHLWLASCNSCGAVSAPSPLSHMRRAALCGVCYNLRENNGRWKGYKELTGVWLSQYRLDAKKRGREFSVTPEQLWQIWEQQEHKCAYTNWPLTHGIDASLDRIDSSKGYTVDNVQWVHRDINRMKSDFDEDYFLTMCLAVAGG